MAGHIPFRCSGTQVGIGPASTAAHEEDDRGGWGITVHRAKRALNESSGYTEAFGVAMALGFLGLDCTDICYRLEQLGFHP